MAHDEILAILEEYLKQGNPKHTKPAWFECLSFLDGYCGSITLDMVLAVRELQREGRVE